MNNDHRIMWTLNDLLSWAESTLGSTVTTADRSWRHDNSLVLELVDGQGERWFLKHPRDPERFGREVRAYQTALETFGDRVPTLVGSSASYRCLLLGALPGELATGDLAQDPGVHRQAGALLARLHRSDWPKPSKEIGERLASQRLKVLERAKELLGPKDFRFVRLSTAVLKAPGTHLTVPCHRDYWPRNWIIGPDGLLRVIDFGHAEADLAVQDFKLLARNDWVGHPELREAFFEGYGRALSPYEEAQLSALVTLSAVNKVLKTSEQGNKQMIRRAQRSFDRLRARAEAAQPQPPPRQAESPDETAVGSIGSRPD